MSSVADSELIDRLDLESQEDNTSFLLQQIDLPPEETKSEGAISLCDIAELINND